jgi:hypothetical protein
VILQNIVLLQGQQNLKTALLLVFSKHRSSTGTTKIKDDFACDPSKHRSSFTGTIEIKDDFACDSSKHRSSTGRIEIKDDFACDSSKHCSSTGSIEIFGWDLS